MAVKVYYIVNPSGTIHDVTRENAEKLLQRVGYRLATKEEVKSLKAAKGLQSTKVRHAKAHKVEIEDAIDIDELAAELEAEEKAAAKAVAEAEENAAAKAVAKAQGAPKDK